jgi:60 kDa SS-A/Ro ribonucleoprotein
VLARAFEAWKHGDGPLPDVPFEMLTALPLSAGDWKELARRMTTTQLRMNLDSLLRHGVFDDPAMVADVAARIADHEEIRRAGAMPHQLLTALRSLDSRMPLAIVSAIAEALERSVTNVPELSGHVALCPDVSGSMQSRFTGHRAAGATKVRCIDVAALVTAAVLSRAPGATVVPFSDDVVLFDRPLEPRDAVVANAERLTLLPGGGTACAAPLRWINARGAAPDVVIVVSDKQSWADFQLTTTGGASGTRATVMSEEWQRLRGRNPKAKLVLIDLQPSGEPGRAGGAVRDDVLHVGGFSDAVFDVLAAFTRGERRGDACLDAIERTSID